MDPIQLAAKGHSTVLITGPTGAGKTSLAKKIHEMSARKFKPFVTVNLASLHEGIFESELFGHERGAFTGADHRRVGRLEIANGGTVFLDEVGELSPRLQARLLEFLQSRTISPVGSNREIKLDVRVIVATHRDLARAVANGDFREDLFHRLRVISIELLPLNERCDEFDQIVHTCLSEVCEQNGSSILKLSEELAHRLEAHDWPGNFRELRNVLEYAVLAASEDHEIRLEHLPSWFAEKPIKKLGCEDERRQFDLAQSFARLDYSCALGRFEKDYLSNALERNHWRINRTARSIGMNKTTLMRRMRMHGIGAPAELTHVV